LNNAIEFNAALTSARAALWLTLACASMTWGCACAPGTVARGDGDSDQSDGASSDSGTSDSTAGDSGVSNGDGDIPIPDLPGPMYCGKPSDCPDALNCYLDRVNGEPVGGDWICQPHGGLELGEPCAPEQFVEECGHGLFCFGPYPTGESSGARCVPMCATVGGEDPIDFCAGEDDECLPIGGQTGPFIGVCSKSCVDWIDSADCDFGDQCFSFSDDGCIPSRKPPAAPGTECDDRFDCGIGRTCFGPLEGVCPGRVDVGCCGVLCDHTSPTDTSCADAGLASAVCVPYEFEPPAVAPEGFGVCSIL
jgi:hypothetical protein